MKKFMMLGGAVVILLLNPVAAFATCDSFCTNHCQQAHPNNPTARGNCYGGCVAGCQAALEVEP